MYWHNPTSRTSERVDAPLEDEEAIRMLAGHPSSATFVSDYAELRHSGMPIETALVMVGHEERLRQHDHMPVRLAERERPRGRARPSATAYVLLLALRLREEGKGKKEGKGKNFSVSESLRPGLGESTFYGVG
jgi:hypothetical protein